MNHIEPYHSNSSSNSMSSLVRSQTLLTLGAEALILAGLAGCVPYRSSTRNLPPPPPSPSSGDRTVKKEIIIPSDTFLISTETPVKGGNVTFKDAAEKVTGEWFVVVSDCFEPGRVDIDVMNRDPLRTQGIKNRVISAKQGSTVLALTNDKGEWLEGVDGKFEEVLAKFNITTTSAISASKILIGGMVTDVPGDNNSEIGFYEIGVLGTPKHPVGLRKPQPYYLPDLLKGVERGVGKVAKRVDPALREVLAMSGLETRLPLGEATPVVAMGGKV